MASSSSGSWYFRCFYGSLGFAIGWWVVLSMVIVTWFLVLFACQCGPSNGLRLPLKWVCLPWILMHLALTFWLFVARRLKSNLKTDYSVIIS